MAAWTSTTLTAKSMKYKVVKSSINKISRAYSGEDGCQKFSRHRNNKSFFRPLKGWGTRAWVILSYYSKPNMKLRQPLVLILVGTVTLQVTTTWFLFNRLCLNGGDASPPGRREVGTDVIEEDDLVSFHLEPLKQQAARRRQVSIFWFERQPLTPPPPNGTITYAGRYSIPVLRSGSGRIWAFWPYPEVSPPDSYHDTRSSSGSDQTMTA